MSVQQPRITDVLEPDKINQLEGPGETVEIPEAEIVNWDESEIDAAVVAPGRSIASWIQRFQARQIPQMTST